MHENSNSSVLNRVYNTLHNQSTITKLPNLNLFMIVHSLVVAFITRTGHVVINIISAFSDGFRPM